MTRKKEREKKKEKEEKIEKKEKKEGSRERRKERNRKAKELSQSIQLPQALPPPNLTLADTIGRPALLVLRLSLWLSASFLHQNELIPSLSHSRRRSIPSASSSLVSSSSVSSSSSSMLAYPGSPSPSIPRGKRVRGLLPSHSPTSHLALLSHFIQSLTSSSSSLPPTLTEHELFTLLTSDPSLSSSSLLPPHIVPPVMMRKVERGWKAVREKMVQMVGKVLRGDKKVKVGYEEGGEAISRQEWRVGGVLFLLEIVYAVYRFFLFFLFFFFSFLFFSFLFFSFLYFSLFFPLILTFLSFRIISSSPPLPPSLVPLSVIVVTKNAITPSLPLE